LAHEAVHFLILCPARFLDNLAQAAQGGPRLLLLLQPVLGHGKERELGRLVLLRRFGPRQGGQGILQAAGAILGHAQRASVALFLGSDTTSCLRLAEGEAVLEIVEVWLAENRPTGLVIALRVGLLAIAPDQLLG